MIRFAVYLVPGFLLGETGDPVGLLSSLEAKGAAPVLTWTSPHDVLDFLLGGWKWSEEGGPPNERVYVMRPSDLGDVDLEDLSERAQGLALKHAIDAGELERALDADTVTEHADDVLGALVIAVHTLRNAVITATENAAALAIVIRRPV